MESVLECEKCASNEVCQQSRRSRWRRGACTCRCPYKRYESTLPFPKVLRKRVFVSMAPCSSTSSRKFGGLVTKKARSCWRSGTLKESCPSRALHWKTCTRREKGGCSGVIRSDLGDLAGLDLFSWRNHEPVKITEESHFNRTWWTLTLATFFIKRIVLTLFIHNRY